MHSISGALRLLSPSTDKCLTSDSEPEKEENIEELQDNDLCPHCHLNYDRVPPLPADGEHRRSSSIIHGHGSRDISPRNKATAVDICFNLNFPSVASLYLIDPLASYG